MTLLRRFLSVGVTWVASSPSLRRRWSRLESPRPGRCACACAGYGARVAGRTRPGELLKVTLRSGAWSYMVVTAVVGGVPGRWHVLTSWPKAWERCANRGAVAPPTAASGRNASGGRQSRGRPGCA